MLNPNEIKILDAIRTLKSVCDGAKEVDGQGFNACDVSISTNILALTDTYLTNEIFYVAYQMLRKYQKQLLNHGIDFLDLEEPKIEGENPTDFADLVRTAKTKSKQEEIIQNFNVVVSETCLKCIFEYDEQIKDAIKSVVKARWDGIEKCWKIPLVYESLNALEATLETLGVSVASDIQEIFDNADSYRQAKRQIILKDFRVIFHFDFEYEIKDAVKSLSSIWNASDKYWSVKLSKQNAGNIIEVIKRYNFKISESDLNKIESVKNEAETNVEKSYAATSDLVVKGLKGVLKPFQKAGVEYLLSNSSAILADEMGLGKTIQAIAVTVHQNAFPCLVVCPASLKLNWKKEIEKWSDKTVQIFDPKAVSRETDFVVINYESLDKLPDENWKTVIFDESQKVKNDKMAKNKLGQYEYSTKCVREALRVSRSASFRYLLTGTPMVNRPLELVSQLDILGRIEDFGGVWKFKHRYCDPEKTRWGWDFSGASNVEELKDNLRKICLIRREKKNVLQELPDKQRQEIPVEISNRSEYNKASKDLFSYVKEKVALDKEFRAELFSKKLSQKEIKDAIAERSQSAEEKAKRAEVLVKINTLRQVAGKGKIADAVDWLETFLETGKKIVLFCHYKESVKILKEALKPHRVLTITGDDSEQQRQANVEEFQNNPASQIILCTLKAGGVGITLTAASDVAFLEVGWTPAELDQAEDRCHRMTQKNAVNCYYFKGLNTIDVWLYDLIEEKRAIVNLDKTASVQSDLMDLIIAKMEEEFDD